MSDRKRDIAYDIREGVRVLLHEPNKPAEKENSLLRDIGLSLGLVKARTEGSYKFTGATDDPEWKRFKRDHEKDKADGF
jgi:hypothetical protein